MEVGAPERLDHAADGRGGAGEPRLLRHDNMLPAPGAAVAERIGKMLDVAVEGGLRHRLAHRDLALRLSVAQARQRRIVHRRAADGDIGIGGKLRQIVPVHPGLPRQFLDVDGIALAQILDGE